MDAEPVVRIALAALMSIPIGLDRELHGKPAGLRTHLLLATSTAALGYLSVELAEGDLSADPTRIASYVVAGVGFLGAGLIVGVRGRVYGLTTAAAAFSVMAIGVLNGTGFHLAAVTLTAVSLLALWPVDWLKPRTYGRYARSEVTLHVSVLDVTQLADVLRQAERQDVEVRALETQPLGDSAAVVQLTVRGRLHQVDSLVTAITDHPATSGRPIRSGASAGDAD